MERTEAYADILLDRTMRREAIPDARDRALLTELVMGTLRRRGTLDFALAPHLSRPLDAADPVARNALRLGAYQLLDLRLPERASVFETVEAAKRARGARVAAFVNAVLRSLQRAGGPPPWPQGGSEAELSARLSAPRELVRALVRTLGKIGAEAFLAESLERPPFTVFANPFRNSREELAARLAAAGADPAPCRFSPWGLVVRSPGAVHADPAFREGRYLVMDEGAQLVALLLCPRPGEAVLDACAAPGGKTLGLSALAQGKARIVAADLSASRVRILRETLARTGAPGVDAVVHDLEKGPLPGSAGRFDRILLDVPCSGSGVIRRNPDAKWRFDPRRVTALSRLQARLLRNAWLSLRPGGALLYCTCSVLREENEEVVERFLEATPGARAEPRPPAGWPGPADAWTRGGFGRLSPERHGTDGFFAALLLKER